MRIFPLLLLAALAATSAPALAHGSHGPCPESDTELHSRFVHVDVYRRGCLGATVTLPPANCALGDLHPISGLHTPVLSGAECETGVILETLEAGLLP